MMPRSLLLIPALFAAACSSPGSNAQQASATPTPAPVPSGTPTPLPAGAPFIATRVADFNEPFAIAFLPDGAALVTEKAGHLQLWQAGQATQEVTGVPKVAGGGQGGLLDVAPAPDFANSNAIYFTYSEPRANGSALALARARLTRGRAMAARLDNVEVLFRTGADGQGGQFGAVIAFAPDGKSLFLASGERQRFTPAQDPNQAIGKILHLTLDGKPAPDNPEAGKTGATTVQVFDPPRDTEAAKTANARPFAFDGPNPAPAAIWTSGHRNPYGMAFDAAGNLWEHEMGPQGGDELNLIVKGRNYGWPNVSFGENYNNTPIPKPKAGDGYEMPKLHWVPSISPAGMLYYTGSEFPQWKGSLLMGAMSGQALIRIALDGTTARKADQWDMGTRIRDVAQGPDGALWLLEDGARGAGGWLLRISPKK
ncbi:PQQ-dependent sugar dehydrogenase [Sphingomonas sp. HT-1]|uniref:PQQ-dependent sugar dehydrogenase n=1 Tax=unclassified Sphingomonas TaxID=196159 RepID=UPI0002D76DC0|nr:PQQ-dependent sugar dehydrogenase [Sphingomonas sp. WG]